MADSSLSIYGSVTSNEVKPEKKKKKKPDLPVVPIKNTADYQRMKLERLMANPDKPVVIPTRPRDKNLPGAPEFVRNVMGSSAGAGSGEFHVYRHLRRKEYARQRAITDKATVEELDDEFQRKLEENKQLADLKTAKKRAKRMKKKQKSKKPKDNVVGDNKKGSSDSSSDEDDGNSSDNLGNENVKNGKSTKTAGQKNASNSNNIKKVEQFSSNKTPTVRVEKQLYSSSDSDC